MIKLSKSTVLSTVMFLTYTLFKCYKKRSEAYIRSTIRAATKEEYENYMKNKNYENKNYEKQKDKR